MADRSSGLHVAGDRDVQGLHARHAERKPRLPPLERGSVRQQRAAARRSSRSRAAGKDSNALMVAPPGAGEPGAVRSGTWKYGRFSRRLPARSSGTHEAQMLQGSKRTAATFFSATDRRPTARSRTPATLHLDEMQHTSATGRRWRAMWRPARAPRRCGQCACSHTDEREIQHCARRRRAVVVVPDRRHRRGSNRGAQLEYFHRPRPGAATAAARSSTRSSTAACPAGTATPSTTRGADPDDRDARGPQRTPTRSQSQGVPPSSRPAATSRTSRATGRERRYERAINIVHDAAIKAKIRVRSARWRERPDFTCFQAGSETAAIARGWPAELGPLAKTQGKPEAGPFAR